MAVLQSDASFTIATGAVLHTPRDAQALWQAGQQHVLAGRFDAARDAFRGLLARHPEQLGARLLLAGAVLAQGRVREAAAQLLAAADPPPTDIGLFRRVVEGLLRLGEADAARRCLRHPSLARLHDPVQLLAIAHQCQALGLHADALALMDRARDAGMDSPDFRYFRALQLQFNGRLDEAEAGMEASLRAGPTFGRASLSLARIRKWTAANNHVDYIRARLRSVAPGSQDHAAFEFALYEELDDLDDRDQAWQALQRGNAIMAARRPYVAADTERTVDRLAALFDGRHVPAGSEAMQGPAPIFVVGLPRSGTTLVERILARHPQVAAAGELDDLPRQLRWVADVHGFPLLDDALLDACADGFDFALLGRRYLAQTQWRANGRAFYVDKLPPNFLLLGFIRAALPQARIVHVVRDPMDVCHSNYRAMFGDAYAYSYGLDGLAHYHGQYARLMRHWRRVLPGGVHALHYDALVRDPESAVRSLLQACGLPWDPACLDHSRGAGTVATLSSAQVRGPLHARGLGEWRRYATQLEPLRVRLEAA